MRIAHRGGEGVATAPQTNRSPGIDRSRGCGSDRSVLDPGPDRWLAIVGDARDIAQDNSGSKEGVRCGILPENRRLDSTQTFLKRDSEVPSMQSDLKTAGTCTLTLSEEERNLLLELLETDLGETRVEVHHTQTPGFRERVKHREVILRALIEKFRQA
jgi:hypothetical protein